MVVKGERVCGFVAAEKEAPLGRVDLHWKNVRNAPLSNPDRTDITKGELTGEIYKLELDGTIVGKFGRSDNSRGSFRTPHFIDCINENELIEVSVTDDFHFIKLLPQ